MATASATAPETVAEYIAGLPDDRRKAIKAVRATIRKNLPKGYAEGIQYGMVGYFVPHRIYPAGYHCDPRQPVPFASIASQKNHMAVYLMCIYGDPEHRRWFESAWKATGRRLDAGKACVRFKSLDDVALDVIGEAIRRVPVDEFLAFYEANLPKSARARAAGDRAGRPRKAPRSR